MRHPYDLPQESTGDVYLMVGLGARALHETKYPILAVSKISLQRYEFLTELQGEDYTNREGYKFLCSKINLWVDFVKKFVYLQSI